MAMTFLAMWLEDPDVVRSIHAMSTYLGILAISVAVLMLLLVVGGGFVAVQVLKSVKVLTEMAVGFQGKAGPILDEVAVISKHTRDVLEDAKPKIKVVTENLARTSATLSDAAASAKSAVEKVEATVTDANVRTQRQVARVDGMVSAALNTTSDVVESINHGIRVPAQKIAQAATQARTIVEGLLERIKGVAAATPFGARKAAPRPSSYGSGRPSPGGTYSTAGSPSESSGTTYAAAPKSQ